eukprot:TRINITY_DN37186_c0_g1_i1.p1 TRINITY_DN37186_c0_g1~~TRINITY_DN37186_c0_g1_i1.p1  ORF type:complete len:1211 (-),score=220.49 TRINITY_DN37186_c0_g1_i1:82-3714(-)
MRSATMHATNSDRSATNGSSPQGSFDGSEVTSFSGSRVGSRLESSGSPQDSEASGSESEDEGTVVAKSHDDSHGGCAKAVALGIYNCRLCLVICWPLAAVVMAPFALGLVENVVPLAKNPPQGTESWVAQELFTERFPELVGMKKEMIMFKCKEKCETAATDFTAGYVNMMMSRVLRFKADNPGTVLHEDSYFSYGTSIDDNPMLSHDKQAVLMEWMWRIKGTQKFAALDFVDAVESEIALLNSIQDKIVIAATGPTFLNRAMKRTLVKEVPEHEMMTLWAPFSILAWKLRSVKLLLLALCSMPVAILLSFGSMYFVSLHTTVLTYSLMMMLMLNTALSFDYSLFTLTRYSEERRNGAEVKDAILTVITQSGHVVVVSGLVLSIAYAAMLVLPGAFKSFCIAACSMILCTIGVQLSFIPACLAVCPWLGPPKGTPKNPAKSQEALLDGEKVTHGSPLTPLERAAPFRKGIYYRIGGPLTAFPLNIIVPIVIYAVMTPFTLRMCNFRMGHSFQLQLPRHRREWVLSREIQASFSSQVGCMMPMLIIGTSGVSTSPVTPPPGTAASLMASAEAMIERSKEELEARAAASQQSAPAAFTPPANAATAAVLPTEAPALPPAASSASQRRLQTWPTSLEALNGSDAGLISTSFPGVATYTAAPSVEAEALAAQSAPVIKVFSSTMAPPPPTQPPSYAPTETTTLPPTSSPTNADDGSSVARSSAASAFPEMNEMNPDLGLDSAATSAVLSSTLRPLAGTSPTPQVQSALAAAQAAIAPQAIATTSPPSTTGSELEAAAKTTAAPVVARSGKIGDAAQVPPAAAAYGVAAGAQSNGSDGSATASALPATSEPASTTPPVKVTVRRQEFFDAHCHMVNSIIEATRGTPYELNANDFQSATFHGQDADHANSVNCLNYELTHLYRQNFLTKSLFFTSTLLQKMWEQLVNKDRNAMLTLINPTMDPFSKDAFDLVRSIRKILRNHTVAEQGLGAELPGLGFETYSATSVIMDIIETTSARLPIAFLSCVFVCFLLIACSFGAALIPFKLLFTVILPISWCYGAALYVYEDGVLDWIGWENIAPEHGAGVDWTVPIFTLTIMLGLALDYDVFLFERIYEFREWGFGDRESIQLGLSATGPIISAAGLIFAFTFTSMMLASMPVTNQIGFIFVFSIVVDTFVVRTILVPAMLSLNPVLNYWPTKMPPAKYRWLGVDPSKAV